MSIPSLLASLSEIPDPRKPRGKRHSLNAILAIFTLGLLCGQKTYSAIAHWGRCHEASFLKTLGFYRRPPCASGFHNILKQLDFEEVESRLHQWVQQCEGILPPELGIRDPIALDGKTLRGNRKQGGGDCHILSAFTHHSHLTLDQVPVDDKSNEIPAAYTLLASLALKGRIVTMDALLTQQGLAKELRKQKAHYLMPVKKNQLHLYQDLAFLFSPLILRHADHQVIDDQHDVCHGRVESRRLIVRDIPQDYPLDWPGAKQLLQICRTATDKKTGKERRKVTYAITSLSSQEASVAQLQRIWRDHWSIENCSHWVRDVVMGEDASQCRVGRIPHILTILRNSALALMRLNGYHKIAEAQRYFSIRPNEAFKLICSPFVTACVNY